MALVLAVLYFVLKRVKAKAKQDVSRAMSMAVGVLCGLYLFASEIVSTVYFIIEVGGQIYLEEILYMLMIYAVYGIAAYFCYLFTYKGAQAVLSYKK